MNHHQARFIYVVVEGHFHLASRTVAAAQNANRPRDKWKEVENDRRGKGCLRGEEVLGGSAGSAFGGKGHWVAGRGPDTPPPHPRVRRLEGPVKHVEYVEGWGSCYAWSAVAADNRYVMILYIET
jgi:hypothetical protein